MNKKLTTSLVAGLLIATNLYSSESLSEITVSTATKNVQSIKDVTSNIDVITKEEIEERHFTTITDALNTLAGFSFVSNGGLGNSTSVFLRGMDTDRTLVLIDGIRYQDPSNTSGAAFSHLMISDIERIEVVKGPQSGIWGSDASAGVINIITKKAKKGFNSSVYVEGGSFQTKKFGASVSHKTDKFDAKLSANRILTDGYSSQATYGSNLDDFEKNGYRNTTVSANLGYNLTDSDRVEANYININSLAQYDGSNGNDTKRSDNDASLYSVLYNKKINNHDIKLKYDVSDFDKEELEASASWQVKEYAGKTRLVELNDVIAYNKADSLIVGVSQEQTNVDFTKGDGSKNEDKTKNKSIYVTNTNNFGKLIVSESLRRDDYSSFGTKYTGKVGVKYAVNSDLSVGTNYGTAFNAPNLIQLLNPWGTSNPDLNPEKIKGYDLNVQFKNLSLTYFNNKVNNLINWSGGGYKNVEGTSKLEGYEVKYKKLLTDELLMNLNYTHLSAKDSQDRDLARRAKRQLGVAFDYYGFDKLHLNLNGSYIGTRYNGSNKSGRQTGKYTLWNTVVNYDINDRFKTYLKVNNIFDKYYQTIDGYSSESRAIYIGLKATF